MYVKRDENGDIVKVSKVQDGDCLESVDSSDKELADFLTSLRGQEDMTRSDLDFVRVLEDVIHLLMDKGVIRFTDLPEAARDKLTARQSLRARSNDIGLIGEEGDVI